MKSFPIAAAAALLLAPAAGAATHCPRGALPLPHDATTRAAKEALAEASTRYPSLRTSGARVESSRPARTAGPRGAQVGLRCGATARARTVVVELRFPKLLPSASLSEGVVFVSRFRAGYRVWDVAR